MLAEQCTNSCHIAHQHLPHGHHCLPSVWSMCWRSAKRGSAGSPSVQIYHIGKGHQFFTCQFAQAIQYSRRCGLPSFEAVSLPVQAQKFNSGFQTSFRKHFTWGLGIGVPNHQALQFLAGGGWVDSYEHQPQSASPISGLGKPDLLRYFSSFLKYSSTC